MIRTVRDELGNLASLVRTLALLALAGALYRELRLPPEERTWNGRLLGVVPYDFRMPTVERLRNAYFNTRSDQLFTAEPLGVGWSVNIAAVLKRLGILSTRSRRSTTR